VDTIDKQFLMISAETLRDHYFPKIKEAVELLSDEEVWHRESHAANSVGNLLMHLAGNVRQHIISGVGGKPDVRERPKEFAAHGGISRDALLDELERTVFEAYRVLSDLDPSLLSEERVIQGNKVMLLKDIYHVVEHFAYHAGQIIHIVKVMKQHSFPWYSHLEVSMRI